MRRRWTVALRLILMAGVLALAARFLSRLDWHALASAAAQARLGLIALAAAGNLPLIWLKAVRLERLLDHRLATARLMRFFVTSYAADNLIMSPAGTGLRVSLMHTSGIPLTRAVEVQIVEKALEAITLALLACPLALLPRQPAWVREVIALCLAVGVVAAGAAAWLVLRRGTRGAVLRRLTEFMRSLGRPRLILELGVTTVLAWVVEAALVVWTLQALHLKVPLLVTATLVLLAVNTAALVPGLPANIGPFEASCVLALSAVHVDPARALGFALLYHGLHTIPVTLAGLPGLLQAGRGRRRESTS